VGYQVKPYKLLILTVQLQRVLIIRRPVQNWWISVPVISLSGYQQPDHSDLEHYR